MIISNVRQTGSGFTATTDADGLTDDPMKHMPDRELVGTHLKRAGFSYGVEEEGDNVHIYRTKNGAKTADAHIDPTMDPLIQQARMKEMQRRQNEYWAPGAKR